MVWKHHINGLFGKAILALGLVSIVPVFLIGWHVLNIDRQVLQKEIYEKQHTIAHRIAYAVSEEVSKQIQFFSIFVELHTDFDEHPGLDQHDLDFLLQKNEYLSYVGIMDVDGKIHLSAGKMTDPAVAIPNIVAIVPASAESEKVYIGSVERFNSHLYEFMVFPFKVKGNPAQKRHLLIAEINLDSLEQILTDQPFENMMTIVLSEEGTLMASSPLDNRYLANGISESFIKQLKAMEVTSNKHMLRLNGTEVMVSGAHVPLLNWEVYVLRQAETTSALLKEILFHSFGSVLLIILVMIVFILAVGHWVLNPIVRPLKRLQEVAIKFEREDDYMPTEKDLIIPNNEIGELARVFLHMAVVLGERKAAILAAQKRLESSNAELEHRVQERTQELNQAMEDLVKAERLSTIGQMASIISHEIRNPLAVISNATRLIKTVHPPTEPKLIKQFSIIEEEIQQANHIIGEVLGFARSRDMILSVIDVNHYLQELLLSFPVPVNIQLTSDIDPADAKLKVDVEELKQAIRNLLSNAVEAMPEGGTIVLGSRVGKKVVCIYVADEGPGVSEEIKAKIFNPFYTTKARGTGLGLAVVRKAVSRHHGKLFIYNRPEKGSVFAIYLQIYRKIGDTHYGPAR